MTQHAPDRNVPRFLLYGEAEEEAEARFAHVERIPDRSGPHAWRIAPHRHSSLLQLLLAVRGGGRLRADGREEDFAAPALVVIPPASVHGYDFAAGTDGWVLTVAEGFAAEVAEGGAAALPAAPLLLPLDAAALARHRLEARFGEMAEEFAGAAPGRPAAIGALLRLLLVALDRLLAERALAALPQGDETALFARFRALVERWYREHRPLPDYLRELGVTEKRLSAACRGVAGRTPLGVIQARLVTEARRSLAYTSRGVAETAYALGFRDPAYFSRFYRRHTGQAPSGRG